MEIDSNPVRCADISCAFFCLDTAEDYFLFFFIAELYLKCNEMV